MLPKGYSNGVAAEGRQVFIAGQIGWNERCQLVSDDFVGPAERALRILLQCWQEAGASLSISPDLTWFVTDKATYVARQKEIGAKPIVESSADIFRR